MYKTKHPLDGRRRILVKCGLSPDSRNIHSTVTLILLLFEPHYTNSSTVHGKNNQILNLWMHGSECVECGLGKNKNGNVFMAS